ncbi:terminase large subunit [Paraburkholderia unamae]|uniref:terminase large subunit n=1 Tax=Paraburkholderia unamae TaxID=219649 RepID=UPI000DD309EA|nr:terminase large subunit [Paraburkholderia unamae]
MEWSTACPDWETRIVRRESLIACPPLFPAVADEAWALCSEFRLTDVMGQPLLGEASLPWLRDFVQAVFGAEDPDTGRRHINEFMLMVSKKNAKSTIAAAIMLCALLMNWRQSAELLILSPTKEIADNSYKPIRDFIKADDELSAMLKVQDYFRTITHLDTGATLKVVAADSDTVSGKKASFVFVDELHEFGKQAKASNMLLEATGGLASRPEGFVIYATTQSAEPPAGVFKAKLDYARKVRDGRVADRKFLPVIYEFPQGMLKSKAHEDLNNAYVTNPNWGASVDIERITQLHSQAKEGGEQEFKEFLAKHLNVEIGLALRSDRWAGADFWEAAALAPRVSLEELMARCEVIDFGIDGGGLDDLLGGAAVGRERGTRNWLAWTHAWAHPSVLERRKEIAPRLLDFQRDGDLTIVQQIGDDVRDVADIVSTIYQAQLLDKVGADPAGIGGVLDALAEAGIPEDKVIGISQGWKLSGAIKTAERRLAAASGSKVDGDNAPPDGVLMHGGQPMMAWCVGNARVVPVGNAVNITKQASGTGKIDPLMALFNAVTLMSLNPQAAPQPGIVIL